MKPLATEIEGIEHGGDLAPIVDVAKRIEAEIPSLRGEQLLAARKLASRAWGAAARLSQGLEAAEMFAKAYVHLYDTGDFHQLAGATEILQALFADDPCQWGPHVARFLALEQFAVACSPGEWDSDARWWHKDVDWGTAGTPPDKLRIVTSTGEVILTKGPDAERPYAIHLERRSPRNAAVPEGGEAPAGIASVWVPEVRDLGTAGVEIGTGAMMVREPGWSRIFWCPVERRWKEDTVPEVLMKRGLSPALDEVYSYAFEELNRDILPAMRALREWEGKIDSLAIHEYDPAFRAIPEHTAKRAEEAISQANRLLDEVAKAHDRSLRRRVRMQRGLVRVREVLSLLDNANHGERVDVAAVSDPKAVRRTSGATGEKEAVLAALDAFATNTRIDTMRESGIDRFAQDSDVVAKLLEMAKDDLRIGDSAEATRVLQRWKNPEIAAWLEGRISGEAGHHTGLEDRYEGSVPYWEKAAADGSDPILQEKAIHKLGIVKEAERDAAAAALARLAPVYVAPARQVQAVEELVRLHRPAVLREVVLLLRYPSAREKAAKGLSTDASSPALEELLWAQNEAWRFKRRMRRGKELEDDPKALLATWKGRLERKGALDKLRAAGLDGFEANLLGLLDPRRLIEDKWLEEAFGRGGTSAPETLATLAQPTELTRDWARKAGQGSDDDRLLPLLSPGAKS